MHLSVEQAPLIPPCFLCLDLPEHVMRNVSKFCVRVHTCAVGFTLWHYEKCSSSISCAAVQNEVHILLHCRDLFVCSPRKKYTFLFLPFCQSFSVEAPYCSHASSNQTVFDFLSQRHNQLCCFSSDVMDSIRRKPATNQSA